MSSSGTVIDEASAAITSDLNEATPRSRAFASLIRRGLQEPLVHFLLIGVTLFIAYSLLTPSTSQSNSTRIELTTDDLNQLQVTWMSQWKRPPTPDEMQGLIEIKVRQEILYREAMALGLDQNDEIIKRRLAQKMEFLGEDVASIREPQPEELRTWFGNNSARFALPGRITFRHLYFSPDKRGQRAQADAEKTLRNLSAKSLGWEKESECGDRFVDQNYFSDYSPEQVSKVFGSKFPESVFKLKPGSWQGPVESGLGWHLVWIDTITQGRMPSFEEIDPEQIKSEWTTDQREETKRRAFAAIRERYEIVLPK